MEHLIMYSYCDDKSATFGANYTSKGYVWGYSPNVDVTRLDK